MRIFSGWRAVGKAMLEARRRKVSHAAYAGGLAHTTENRWHLDNVVVSANRLTDHPEKVDVEIRTGDTHVTMWPAPDAATVLRVLAALDLIPAHLAAAEDERYGRCVKCGKLARWWNDRLAARWVHVQPWAVTGPAAHLAEVAS